MSVVCCGVVCVHVEEGGKREGGKGRKHFPKKRNMNLEKKKLNENRDYVKRDFVAGKCFKHEKFAKKRKFSKPKNGIH